MKTYENTAISLSELNEGKESPTVPIFINGWEINSFPPKITEAKGYAQHSKTTSTQVSSGTAGAIPISKVTPKSDKQVWYGSIGINSDPSCSVGEDNGEYWQAVAGAQLWVMIASPMAYNVELILEMRVNNTTETLINMDIWINGAAFSCNPTSAQLTSNIDWHTMTLPIPSNMLQAGGNTNIIKLMPNNAGAQIKSVSLKAGSVPTTASYYWKRIAENYATKETPQSFSAEFSTEVTNTETEIHSFSAEFGITVQDKVQLELDEITASLNESFKFSESSENSVALSSTTTKTWGVKFEPSDPNESITYELWQLVLEYGAGKNGQIIEKTVSLGEAPIFIRTFNS